MELNREQIIKALEYCAKGNICHLCHKGESRHCYEEVMLDALALIKELTEENERLRERNIVLEQKFIILNREEIPVIKVKVKGE